MPQTLRVSRSVGWPSRYVGIARQNPSRVDESGFLVDIGIASLQLDLDKFEVAICSPLGRSWILLHVECPENGSQAVKDVGRYTACNEPDALFAGKLFLGKLFAGQGFGESWSDDISDQTIAVGFVLGLELEEIVNAEMFTGSDELLLLPIELH